MMITSSGRNRPAASSFHDGLNTQPWGEISWNIDKDNQFLWGGNKEKKKADANGIQFTQHTVEKL
jgi:hypothetical protein